MIDRVPTIFLGGPFSAAMRTTAQGVDFDPHLKSAIEKVLGCIHDLGYRVFSSHIADQYGAEFDANTFVKRDNRWVERCDLYVALLPFDDAGRPYRTDGTFVELGLALACRKRILVAIEQADHEAWSFYVRNLEGASGRLKMIEWGNFMEAILDILKREVESINWEDSPSLESQQTRQQTTDALSVLQHLAEQSTVEEVDFKGIRLRVLPGVFSPKVSHAPDYIVENWYIPPDCKVLDLGCGSGVLGLYALNSGAGELVAIDSNPKACENTLLNAKSLGFEDRTTVLNGDAYTPLSASDMFDVIVLSPPYWNKRAKTPLEAACFDEDHRFLSLSVLGARKHLSSKGSVFLVFSDQGEISRLAQLIQESGLVIDRFLVQRPTMPGGHIRFFYKLTPP